MLVLQPKLVMIVNGLDVKMKCTIKQLCPKCRKLFTVSKGPIRTPREVIRQIECPKCCSEKTKAIGLLKRFKK